MLASVCASSVWARSHRGRPFAGACGMSVVGVRAGSHGHSLVDVVFAPERITEAFADADFVVLACPLTSETRA